MQLFERNISFSFNISIENIIIEFSELITEYDLYDKKTLEKVENIVLLRD